MNDDNGPLPFTGMKVVPVGNTMVAGLAGDYEGYRKVADYFSSKPELHFLSFQDKAEAICSLLHHSGVKCNFVLAGFENNVPQIVCTGTDYGYRYHIEQVNNGTVRTLLPPDVTDEMCRRFFTSIYGLKIQTVNCIRGVSRISQSVNDKICGFEITPHSLKCFTDGIKYEDISVRIIPVNPLHINLLMQSFQSDALISFLPILSALPFGGCFVDDLKSKFARFFLIRSSYRTYIVSRIIVGFLAGGLAILAGALIAWGTTAAVLIPIEREIEGAEPAAIDGLIETCFLLFFNGGFWSVVGMAMSTLMESKYISYATPFVLYYLLVILYERYFSDLFIIYPKTWTFPTAWPFGCWGAAIFLLEMTLIFAILFAFRAGRRLQQL